jgi:hypothetical protein
MAPKKGHRAAGEPWIVPLWDRSAAKVQPACNTQFEFVLSHPARLDKIAIPQHAGDSLVSPKAVRFGFDRFGLGLGT